ncbi:MAG: PKD domain-containing protein, partial [Methanomicrobiales archaeon]|nr:PKD domain-containing protein [Methanomicrobiales archaeon]
MFRRGLILFILAISLIFCCISDAAAGDQDGPLDLDGTRAVVIPTSVAVGTTPVTTQDGGEMDGGRASSGLYEGGMGSLETWIRALPLQFIRNDGQFQDGGLYHIISDSGSVSFNRHGVAYTLIAFQEDQPRTTRVTTSFLNSLGNSTIEGTDPLPGSTNFFLGNQRASWRTQVPAFRAISYKGLYPRIDLRYSGSEGSLKSEFIIAPGGEPGVIRMQYSGAKGIVIEPDGSLTIVTAVGTITELAPDAYQEVGGNRIEVPVQFSKIGDSIIGFTVGPYDRAKPLVIDPVMKYALYLSGAGVADARGITTDAEGNAYVLGTTYIPQTLQGDTSSQDPTTDIILMKINSDGTAPLFTSYLGGSGTDTGKAVVLDPDLNVYLTGTTTSTDFPVEKPLQRYNGGGSDAFVTKIDPEGAVLIFSTYLGGSRDDEGNGLALDAVRSPYVVGTTSSKNFPAVNRYNLTSLSGPQDAFITKYREDGGDLIYSDFIGGSSTEVGSGVVVDSEGYAVITGETFSPDYPTVSAYQSRFAGVSDVFLTRLTLNGDYFTTSTLLGGAALDYATGLVMDRASNVYLTGATYSPNFPVKSGVKTSLAGTYDAFAARFDPTCTELQYSTFLGGSAGDAGKSIAVDSHGNAFVTGFTFSIDFPVFRPYQSKSGGGYYDAFIVKLSPHGSAYCYSTYLGGAGPDWGNGIAVDPAGNAYVTGLTGSMDFPRVNPYINRFGGGDQGGFLAVFSDDYIPGPEIPIPGFSGVPRYGDAPLTVQFSNKTLGYPLFWNWSFGDGTYSNAINPDHTYQSADLYTVSLTVTNDAGSATKTKEGYINVTGYKLPIANFTANVTAGKVPLSVQFTDLSQNNPTEWMWEFGDGGTSIDQNPAYTYNTKGTYSVTLTAKNLAGSNSTTKYQYITADEVPIANFTSNVTSGKAPLSVQFTDISQNNPTGWSWEFGDGGTSLAEDPVYSYTTKGTYTVKLTVTNSAGSNSTTKYQYITTDDLPIADFNANVTAGKVPLSVQFTDTSQNNPTGWSWEFGDGGTSTAKDPIYTYTNKGAFTVKLTATNSAGSNSTIKYQYITTDIPPVADFNTNVTAGKVPLSVQFTDMSLNNPTGWSWEFGDGGTSIAEDPVYTYTNKGTFTVKLTVTNSAGADFKANVTAGKVPLSVQFTDMSLNNPTGWSWEFGDGGTSTAEDPVYTYTTKGIYTVKLTVTNSAGSNITTKQEYIHADDLPVADFKANVTAGKVPLSVQFTDRSLNNPTGWSWEFGEGGTSTAED